MISLEPKTTKADAKAQLKQFILAHCDTDIRQQFEGHYYTLEPLLLQVIRVLESIASATRKDSDERHA